MKLDGINFGITDWDQLTESSQVGEVGTSSSRVVEAGPAMMRMVRYSKGFLADHWCRQGHLGHVLEGEVVLEMRDGSTHTVVPGLSFQIPDGEPHRVSSPSGALVLIVD